MRFLSFLIFISFTFGGEVCLKFNNLGVDPYIAHRMYHHIKNLFLEAGFRLSCSGNTERMSVEISYSETPISVSSRQRVSSYILSLRVRLNEKTFSSSVPYSVNASYGEIPRRRAIEEAFGRIKLNILD